MAESLYELMLAEMAPDGDSPPPEGATDSVGMGERVHRTGCTVDAASRGDSSRSSLEEARQQVRDAQSALVALGYDIHGHSHGHGIDAVWGLGTQAALRQFQEEYELHATGHLDAATYEALMALYERAVESHESVEPEDDYMPMPGRHG